MRDSTRRPRLTRAVAAVVVAAAGLGLLAACGGSSPAGSAGPAAGGGSAVGYSACIRSHGVPGYPDPDGSGQLPKTDAQQLGVSTAGYQAAQQACQRLLPAGGSAQQQDHQCMQDADCSPALVQQMMTADLALARCMRSHGVPDFPDPTSGGPNGPVFDISAAGISDAASHSSQFEAALTQCGRLAGPDAPESFE